MQLAGKEVLVVGLARSGIAAAIELNKKGSRVIATDLASRDELKDIRPLEELGVEMVLGEHPLGLLDSCDFVVVSPGVPSDIAILEEARKRDIPVISELELGFRLAKAPIIAITGTNGKTTTTTLAGEILKNDGRNISVSGNIGVPLIQEAADDAGRDYLVVEVSSFQLENIVAFRPKIGVILNLTEDHLNRHKTFENYIEIKAKIMENQSEEDYIVLNYDDNLVRSLAKRAKGNVVFFSRDSELPRGVFVKNGVIVIKENGNLYPILKTSELGILGKHNLENALAAVCVAWLTRTNLNSLAETLKGFHGVEHRLEHVAVINDVSYVNDSKGTNPDASQKAIEAIEGLIILIAGGYNKNSDFTHWVKSFGGKVKKVILIGETAGIIERAAYAQGYKDIQRADSMGEAVLLAAREALPGESVLLSPACASWDMFKNFEERGRVFKESVYSLYQMQKK